jgi:hypothetical protein
MRIQNSAKPVILFEVLPVDRRGRQWTSERPRPRGRAREENIEKRSGQGSDDPVHLSGRTVAGPFVWPYGRYGRISGVLDVPLRTGEPVDPDVSRAENLARGKKRH